MAAKPLAAVILAAGMGTRLRDLFSGLPKGFVQIGDETLIERSLRLLREHGIERVLIVAGHLGEAYHDLAKSHSGVRVIENPAYADTGSMASLALALKEMSEDFLLLESDLFYEERAVRAVCARPEADVLLASDETGATDEVWIQADERNCLVNMSKQSKDLDHVSGELVGIVKISASTGRAMLAAYRRFVSTHGHGQMGYETEALVEVARENPIYVERVDGLIWGEVDYEQHYLRVRDEVFPAWVNQKNSGGERA